MSKRKKKGNNNTGGPHRLFLTCFLLAMGELPNPRANTKALQEAVLNVIARSAPGPIIDPELPDSYLSVMLPILYGRRGMTPSDVKVVLMSVQELGKTAGPTVGVLSSVDVAQKESFFNNLGDVASSVFDGDSTTTLWNEVTDLFGDIFT